MSKKLIIQIHRLVLVNRKHTPIITLRFFLDPERPDLVSHFEILDLLCLWTGTSYSVSDSFSSQTPTEVIQDMTH